MEGRITFFGSGGARFVVSKQTRATGGLWLEYRQTRVFIDPGPGAIVKVNEAGDTYDPANLDGLILTHKHMDHANDANVIIEAMTNGGFARKGVLFCPSDTVGDDPIILKHARSYPERIEFLREQGRYRIKDIEFSTPVRHHHPVETYGLLFHFAATVGLIADTRYFEGLETFYKADYLIVNVLRTKTIENHDPVEHLALNDFIRIVTAVKPKTAIMTHFGLKMIEEDPGRIAERLRQKTGINIIAAFDGMEFTF